MGRLRQFWNLASADRLERDCINTKDISTAKDSDLRASLAALRRASALARKEAIQTDTDLVVVVDGKLTLLRAKALRDDADGSTIR